MWRKWKKYYNVQNSCNWSYLNHQNQKSQDKYLHFSAEQCCSLTVNKLKKSPSFKDIISFKCFSLDNMFNMTNLRWFIIYFTFKNKIRKQSFYMLILYVSLILNLNLIHYTSQISMNCCFYPNESTISVNQLISHIIQQIYVNKGHKIKGNFSQFARSIFNVLASPSFD